MTRILDYKCPVDTGAMTKVNGHLFCSQCQKKVHDFKNKSDYKVLYELNRIQGEKCISIQSSRLALVTRKVSRWKLLIILIFNIKTFFFQKLKAQTLNKDTTLTPTSRPVIRTLNGNVLDKKTGKKINFPIIECYKFDVLLETVNGDKDGNFHLLVRGPASQTDSITLRIYSKSHSGSIIPNVKLQKATTHLTVKISKEGVLPEIPEYIGNPEHKDIQWTGRLLD